MQAVCAIVTAIVLAAGLPGANPAAAAAGSDPKPFCDIPTGSYFTKAAAWAKGTGITTGVSETDFDGDGVTTRAQLVTLLHRYSTWRDGASSSPLPPHGFTDVADGAFFEEAVRWARATGVTTGVGVGAVRA